MKSPAKSGPPRSSFVALALAALALGACGGEAPLEPVDTFKAGPPVDAGATDSGGGGVDAGPEPDAGPKPPIRTVEVRNPFGDAIDNYLADGDFELSIAANGGQYGWRALSSNGAEELTLRAETGGLCKSGLRCAIVEKGVTLFATGATAPNLAEQVATLWFKPPQGALCEDLRSVAIDCSTFTIREKLEPTGEVDERGWCKQEATVAGQRSGVCLYLEAKFEAGHGLVDAASVRQVVETKAKKVGAIGATPPTAWAAPAELKARVRSVGERLRKSRQFGKLPPKETAPSDE